MGKEEIARNEQFLLFPQCFVLNQKIVYPLVNIFDIISLFASELEEAKIGLSDKGLSLYETTILDQFKIKAFADDNLNIALTTEFVFDRSENISGKDENAGYQQFLLFQLFFQKLSLYKVTKSRDCVLKG